MAVGKEEWLDIAKLCTAEHVQPIYKIGETKPWTYIPVDTNIWNPISEYNVTVAMGIVKEMKKKTINLPPPGELDEQNYFGTGLSWNQIVFLLKQKHKTDPDLAPDNGTDFVKWLQEIAKEIKSANVVVAASQEATKKKKKKPEPPKDPEDFNRFDIEI